MIPKLDKQERESLNRMRLYFGKTKDLTQEFFESLSIFVVMEYLEGRDVILPFLGKLSLSYLGDTVTEEGRIASIKSSFEAGKFIVRNVGQVQDEVITDAENVWISRLFSSFVTAEGSGPTKESK